MAGHTVTTEPVARRVPDDLEREARDLQVGSLVHIPAGDGSDAQPDRPAVQILRGPAAPDAEAAGRAWLMSARPRPGPGGPCGEGSVLVPLRSPEGVILGVVVVTALESVDWSAPDRDRVRDLVERHRAQIEPRTRAAAPPESTAMEFAADLRAAAANDELRLAYQPEYDLATREIVAVEALVRWRHPRLGELGPEWFISLAERTDLISVVGDWVFSRAIETLAGWNRALPGLRLQLRVNVSPVQLVAADIVAPILAALERFGVPGTQLCIELTEQTPLREVGEVARALDRLREHGVSSAVDDLGAGYSTLSHLRMLDVDYIKIDRSLVSGIDADRRAQAIVVSLIGLGLTLGLGIVAEGVETEDEAQTLLRLGCGRAQGHHLGRPMDATTVEQLLTEHHRRS